MEALLKGSVIISQPAVKQEEIETVVTQDQTDIAVTNDQTEVAVVEITDQHVGNFPEVEYQHLQSYHVSILYIVYMKYNISLA